MANEARANLNKILADWGGGEVIERGNRYIKVLHPLDPGRERIRAGVGGLWHLPGTDTEIDTELIPSSLAPWLYESKVNLYKMYLGPGTLDFDAGQIIRLEHTGGKGITYQAQALQWVDVSNGEFGALEQIAIPTKAQPVINDDTAHWSGAFGPGIDFTYRFAPGELVKRLEIADITALAPPPAFITNPFLHLQFTVSLSSGVEIWIDGALYNRQNNTDRQTGEIVEFKDATTGEVLWIFNKPHATGEVADGAPIDTPQDINPELHFRVRANNLFVSVLTPWAWLQYLEGRVIIDPTITNQEVASSLDDGYEVYINGSVSATTSPLRASNNTANNKREAAFMRWALAITQGTTINSASIDIATNVQNPDIDFDLYAEDVDNSAALTGTTGEITGKTKSTESVAWAYSGSEVPGDRVTSPDITSLVSSVIVDRGGWGSGNYFGIITAPDGTANHEFDGRQIDYGSGSGAYIDIDYGSSATTYTQDFTANAIIKKAIGQSFTADATLQKTIQQSFTADARIVITEQQSFTTDATIQRAIAQAFTADADIKRAISQTFTADAILKKVIQQSFTADAAITSPAGTTAPTFVNKYQTSWDDGSGSGSKTIVSNLSLTEGDVCVIVVANEGGGDYSLTENGAGSPVNKANGVGNAEVFVWTYTAPTNESVTFTVNQDGSWKIFGAALYHFTDTDGVGVSNTASSTSGSPSVTLTGVSDASAIVMIASDWDAVSGAKAAYTTDAGSFTNTIEIYEASVYGVYCGTYEDAGDTGNKTIGQTAPSPLDWGICGVEVLGIAGGATTYTQDFTADAVIERAVSQSFTANATIQKTIGQDFTADARIAHIYQQSFTVDATIERAVSQSFTGDAVIERAIEQTFTGDATIKREGIEQTFTADAAITRALAQDFTADATIQRAIEQTFDADAVIERLGLEQSFTADAYITTVSIIQQSFTADATIERLGLEQSFTVDAIVLRALAQSFDADATIERSITQTFDADAILQRAITQTFDADATITRAIEQSFTADAYIVAVGTITQNFTVDATIERIGLGQSFTVDAIIQRVFTDTFDADAIIKRVIAQSFDADAAIQNTLADTFTADAVILRSLGQSFTADATIESGAQTHEQSFTANAVILKTQGGSFTVNAYIIGEHFINLVEIDLFVTPSTSMDLYITDEVGVDLFINKQTTKVLEI